MEEIINSQKGETGTLVGMEDQVRLLREENAKLKATLHNLNKIFSEKFEIVKSNEEALKAKEEQHALIAQLKEQLEEQDALIAQLKEQLEENETLKTQLKEQLEQEVVIREQEASIREKMTIRLADLELQSRYTQLESQLSKEHLEKATEQLGEARISLSRSVSDHGSELSNAQESLRESEYRLQQRDKQVLEKEADFRRLQISCTWQVTALTSKLRKLKEDVLDAKEKQMRCELMLNEAQAITAEMEEKLKQARQKNAAELERLYTIEEERHSVPPELPDQVEKTEIFDLQLWGLPSVLAPGGVGVSRLREMLVSHLIGHQRGLEGDDIRKLLQTVRRICVDRAQLDLSPQLAALDTIPLPEYIYAWFGSSASSQQPASKGVNARVIGDGMCGRFLDGMCRLAPKHRELSVFLELLDAGEVDEVSFYVHARRLLVGMETSSKLSMEVPMALASEACARLIMKHASDQHAKKVRADTTKSILTSRAVVSPSGGADVAALLAGLLGVYKEEKQQVKALLRGLHASAGKLREFPQIHKLRALLQSIDPAITDHEVVRIFLHSSVSFENTPSPEEPHLKEPPVREVPFDMLWLVLQRYGLLVKRQGLASALHPELSQESSLTKLAPSALAVWMGVKTHVRVMLRECAASRFECDRLWATRTQALYDGLEGSVSSPRESAMVLCRLRRLLGAVCVWHSQRHERASKPLTNPQAVTAELEQTAELLLSYRSLENMGRPDGVRSELSEGNFRVTKDVLQRPFSPAGVKRTNPSSGKLTLASQGRAGTSSLKTRPVSAMQ